MTKKFKWTTTKIVVTVLIVAFSIFILFKTGMLDGIVGQFFSTSPSYPTPISSSLSSGGGISQ